MNDSKHHKKAWDKKKKPKFNNNKSIKSTQVEENIDCEIIVQGIISHILYTHNGKSCFYFEPTTSVEGNKKQKSKKRKKQNENDNESNNPDEKTELVNGKSLLITGIIPFASPFVLFKLHICPSIVHANSPLELLNIVEIKRKDNERLTVGMLKYELLRCRENYLRSQVSKGIIQPFDMTDKFSLYKKEVNSNLFKRNAQIHPKSRNDTAILSELTIDSLSPYFFNIIKDWIPSLMICSDVTIFNDFFTYYCAFWPSTIIKCTKNDILSIRRKLSHNVEEFLWDDNVREHIPPRIECLESCFKTLRISTEIDEEIKQVAGDYRKVVMHYRKYPTMRYTLFESHLLELLEHDQERLNALCNKHVITHLDRTNLYMFKEYELMLSNIQSFVTSQFISYSPDDDDDSNDIPSSITSLIKKVKFGILITDDPLNSRTMIHPDLQHFIGGDNNSTQLMLFNNINDEDETHVSLVCTSWNNVIAARAMLDNDNVQHVNNVQLKNNSYGTVFVLDAHLITYEDFNKLLLKSIKIIFCGSMYTRSVKETCFHDLLQWLLSSHKDYIQKCPHYTRNIKNDIDDDEYYNDDYSTEVEEYIPFNDEIHLSLLSIQHVLSQTSNFNTELQSLNVKMPRGKNFTLFMDTNNDKDTTEEEEEEEEDTDENMEDIIYQTTTCVNPLKTILESNEYGRCECLYISSADDTNCFSEISKCLETCVTHMRTTHDPNQIKETPCIAMFGSSRRSALGIMNLIHNSITRNTKGFSTKTFSAGSLVWIENLHVYGCIKSCSVDSFKVNSNKGNFDLQDGTNYKVKEHVLTNATVMEAEKAAYLPATDIVVLFLNTPRYSHTCITDETIKIDSRWTFQNLLMCMKLARKKLILVYDDTIGEEEEEEVNLFKLIKATPFKSSNNYLSHVLKNY
jgi:hypothetical protein